MGNPQIAEALFTAHAERATGWLTCTSRGRESRLGFREGQLVAVDLRFGFQAPVQALVQAGRLQLSQLDALWARGEAGSVDAETLEELGVIAGDAEVARALASVKQVLQQAEAARFEPAEVGGAGLVSGARVVRAAWEALGVPEGEAPYFRLRSVDALEGWDVTDAEREWLEASTDLRSADGVSADRRALLEVLARGGALEWIPAEEIRRREAEEQARREAEERARREAEEQARREAEERARREAEEQARREAEERARREAEEQARREAEEQARREAEERARREAEEQARREAEEQARREAEERARREAEEQARLEAEERARREAEEQARREVEERARREAEERARREAEEQARREAEEQARFEAEERARREAEEQAQREAEEQARREAEERARREAEEQARLEAEEQARREAEQAQREAAEQARLEAEEQARRDAEERARREAEAQAQRDAEEQARHENEEQAQQAAAAARQRAEETERHEEEEHLHREAQLRAEEEARRAAEEEQWAREEAELLEKAHAAREAREAAEAQRLEDERRRREEEQEEEELLRRAEAARQAEERRRAETAIGPPPSAPRPPSPSAPERSKSLLDRMNEALRQSALGAAPAPVQPAEGRTARSRDDKTDPHYQVPPGYQDPAAPRRPLVLGGQGGDAEEADLWKIVEPTSPKAAPPTTVQSFEEALRRVDSSLEALVGEAPASGPAEPLVEPIIEAEVEAPSPVATAGSRLEDFDVGDPTDPAEAARLRRQRLLRRAMENLGAIQQPQPGQPRSENVQVVEPAVPASSGSGLRQAPPSSSGSGLRAAPAPTPAEQQLAAQIESRFEAVSKKDHFVTLGLAPGATKDQVKAAFLSLAKVFHPDRLPPSLPHLAQKMSAVFEAIRDAYETLHDDAKRTAYQAMKAGAAQAAAHAAAAASPTQQASDLMKMGEVFFKKRDYRQAESHFQKAHALDKGAHSLAAAAWAIYMDPSRKAEGGDARTMMQKALAIDADCDRAHYQLGVIARVEGDMDTAERHFREAVRVNPRHLEANQEIRLIEMRKKKDASKKGGFFR